MTQILLLTDLIPASGHGRGTDSQHSFRSLKETMCAALRLCGTNMAWHETNFIDTYNYDHILSMNVNWLILQKLNQNSSTFWKMLRPWPPLVPFQSCRQFFPMLMITILYTLKVNWKGNQGLRFQMRRGAVYGPSNGQHPAPWAGESTAGRISLDTSGHHIRRGIRVYICHAGDNVARLLLTIFIFSGNVLDWRLMEGSSGFLKQGFQYSNTSEFWCFVPGPRPFFGT